MIALYGCECPRGNWSQRWPISPDGWRQCQWCGGLRWFAAPTARDHVQCWIIAERALYADVKYAEDAANHLRLRTVMANEGLAPTWLDFIGNYLRRAELFGLDTPQGRQAMGKATVTMLHCLETAVDVFGPMPNPGYPSGDGL